MTKKDYDIKLVAKWECPKEGEDLRALISMPNIPKPCHGEGMQPRTIFGPKSWNNMRRHCYQVANDTCEICGTRPENLRQRHGHEAFDIDYEKGTATFVRVFCVCSLCHIFGIHTGRASSLHKSGNPLCPKEALIAGAENAFRIAYEYNKDHPEADLRLYSTWLDYLKQDDLREDMEGLIEKYKVKFYEEDKKKMAKWGDWKVVVFGKEYPTPYKNEKEWKEAMEAANLTDAARVYATKKKKFEGLDSVEITEADLKKIEQAEVPEGF